MTSKTSALQEKKVPKATTAAVSSESTSQGKKLQGTVVKAAMVGTITVAVKRFVKHLKYKKYYTTTKKFLVDDKSGMGTVGDVVEIVETRPISKRKFFRLVSVVQKSKGIEVDADGL
jgi:small subunit ribosomal protein S17